LALLVLARLSGRQVHVVHVDHGLRLGSHADAEVVRSAADRFDASFETVRVEVPNGPNLEARARTARYGALPDGALTGHTADDQAETVLAALVRGAGIDGLAGMRPARRPLLQVRRSETVALCAELGLAPVVDPSNVDPRFQRNRLRNEVLPLLDDVARRDVVAVISRQAGLLQEDAALLDSLAAHVDPTDARALRSAPRALARRSLRNWLRLQLDAEQHPPDLATVDRVLAVARGEAVATDVGNGWEVRRSSQRLRIGPSRGMRRRSPPPRS